MRILFCCGLFFVLSACNVGLSKKIKGNGDIKTESRTSENFTAVSVSGNFVVYLTTAPNRSVRVKTDQNLMEYIEIYNSGKELIIGTKNNYDLKGSEPIKVYISAPDFEKIDVSGACKVIGENKIVSNSSMFLDMSGASEVTMDVSTPTMKIDISGAGQVALTGTTKNFNIQSSGAADIKCSNFLAENVDVNISGAGSATVFASVTLNVSISGAASVQYKGNAVVKKEVSGAGSIKQIN